jgi:hypothetical protein
MVAVGAAVASRPPHGSRLYLGIGPPSRAGEFHPEPLTDPDLILSHHPARVTARRLPPSAEISGSSRGITQLAQVQRR